MLHFRLEPLIMAMCHDLGILDIDRNYILRRLSAEGIRFLTVELPKFSKNVLRSLELGHFQRPNDGPDSITSFGFAASITKFLGNFLMKVFDRITGDILPNPCGLSIQAMRQICDYFYKLALPFSVEDEVDAKEKFLETEKLLETLSRDKASRSFANELRKDFLNHWASIASARIEDILGSFRPRSTSGTWMGSGDMYFLERESTISRTYPSDAEALKGYWKTYSQINRNKVPGSYRIYPVDEPMTSELLLVPKDSRGPRTICRETRCRVETQMAYFDFMVNNLTVISQGAINFKDQTINQRIAEESSVTKRYATLDLKDASDRVSFTFVKEILSNSPGLRWFFHGSRRATHVVVDGVQYKLAKVAGMGSGLTFPTMSLIISLAICRGVLNEFPDLRYSDVRKNIFIYGDDICLPIEWVDIANHSLDLIGLKVNTNKSYWKSQFRESCGGDFFAGVNVTPIRLKLTNSKPEYFALGNQIGIGSSINALVELYAHTKVLKKNGLLSTSNVVLRFCKELHKQLLGFDMPPGVFREECALFLDYSLGTNHLDVAATTRVATVSPKQMGSMGTRKFVTQNGVLRRDEFKYLQRQLVRERPVKVYGEMNDIEPLTSFEDLTVPRVLELRTQVVPNDMLVSPNENFHKREFWAERNLRTELNKHLSLIIYYAAFHKAYF